METIFLKRLIFGYLILGISTAFAQVSSYEEIDSGYCSHMSKNPKCWEGRDNTQNPRPYFCEGRIAKSCGTIESLHSDSSGGYYCRDDRNLTFDCTQLAQELGLNLKGLAVQITMPYIDTCHIPGGCGPRACVPGFGTASLDRSCQEPPQF